MRFPTCEFINDDAEWVTLADEWHRDFERNLARAPEHLLGQLTPSIRRLLDGHQIFAQGTVLRRKQ